MIFSHSFLSLPLPSSLATSSAICCPMRSSSPYCFPYLCPLSSTPLFACLFLSLSLPLSSLSFLFFLTISSLPLLFPLLSALLFPALLSFPYLYPPLFFSHSLTSPLTSPFLFLTSILFSFPFPLFPPLPSSSCFCVPSQYVTAFHRPPPLSRPTCSLLMSLTALVLSSSPRLIPPLGWGPV